MHIVCVCVEVTLPRKERRYKELTASSQHQEALLSALRARDSYRMSALERGWESDLNTDRYYLGEHRIGLNPCPPGSNRRA